MTDISGRSLLPLSRSRPENFLRDCERAKSRVFDELFQDVELSVKVARMNRAGRNQLFDGGLNQLPLAFVFGGFERANSFAGDIQPDSHFQFRTL